MKIGIIGNGFVGNALYENIKNKFEVKVYDSNKQKSLNSYFETIKADLIFICLPTPMVSIDGGECNLSIIENFFKDLPHGLSGIFIIKSTVPIGTTSKLNRLRPDIKTIHNPEFLTAANAIEDFKNSERNILGGDLSTCLAVEKFFKILLPNTKSIIVNAEESESIKYFSNTFLAMKVSYFNLIFDLCEKLNLNYEHIVSGVIADSRIGFSHTKTPGPDGDRGFGGTCFPKDINALINTFDELQLNCTILKEVWNYNKKIRKNWDWSNNKSAVLSREDLNEMD